MAHAQRLLASPVPYQGWAIRRDEDGIVLACGQFAREAELVGLYDVFTHPQARGRGLSRLLCGRLLAQVRRAYGHHLFSHFHDMHPHAQPHEESPLRALLG